MKVLVYFVSNINYFIEFSLFYSVFSAKIVFFSIFLYMTCFHKVICKQNDTGQTLSNRCHLICIYELILLQAFILVYGTKIQIPFSASLIDIHSEIILDIIILALYLDRAFHACNLADLDIVFIFIVFLLIFQLAAF